MALNTHVRINREETQRRWFKDWERKDVSVITVELHLKSSSFLSRKQTLKSETDTKRKKTKGKMMRKRSSTKKLFRGCKRKRISGGNKRKTQILEWKRCLVPNLCSVNLKKSTSRTLSFPSLNWRKSSWRRSETSTSPLRKRTSRSTPSATKECDKASRRKANRKEKSVCKWTVTALS